MFLELSRSWFFSCSNTGIFWQITDLLRIEHNIEFAFFFKNCKTYIKVDHALKFQMLRKEFSNKFVWLYIFFNQNMGLGKLSDLSISKEVLALEYLKKLSYFMGVKMKLHKIVVCMLRWKKEISKRCESLAIALQPHL